VSNQPPGLIRYSAALIIRLILPTFRFDSSVGRGDFTVKIGTGQVIKGEQPCFLQHAGCTDIAPAGWDEGVVQMKLNEKATLDITRFVGPV
jgi:hypothetical protein